MSFEKERHFTVGVVIVNFRTPSLVEACLRSLAPMLAPADAGVVVVDNASGDGSFERLSRFCEGGDGLDRVRVVAAPENRGFSAGNNIGVAAISATYNLLLNSDAIARPGAISALVTAAKRAPGAGLITPSIVSSTGGLEVSRFHNHTLLSEFVDGAQTGPITRLFASAEIPIYPDDRLSDPDWVSFAAVMMQSEAMEKAGPMDEGFFLYFEDCDYCRRITALGYGIAQAPDAIFQHDAGGTTGLHERTASAARLPAYYYRSRSRYFRKYYGPLGAVFANLAWYAGRAIAKLRGLFGRPAPAVPERRARDIWIGWRGGEKNASRL